MRLALADRIRFRRWRFAVLWAAVVGLWMVVTAIAPVIGTAGALLSTFVSGAFVAALGVAIAREHLGAAIQRHG